MLVTCISSFCKMLFQVPSVLGSLKKRDCVAKVTEFENKCLVPL